MNRIADAQPSKYKRHSWRICSFPTCRTAQWWRRRCHGRVIYDASRTGPDWIVLGCIAPFVCTARLRSSMHSSILFLGWDFWKNMHVLGVTIYLLVWDRARGLNAVNYAQRIEHIVTTCCCRLCKCDEWYVVCMFGIRATHCTTKH